MVPFALVRNENLSVRSQLGIFVKDCLYEESKFRLVHGAGRKEG